MVFRILLSVLFAAFAVACELVETCDPAIDPNCAADPGGGSGTPLPDAGGGATDTGGGTGTDAGTDAPPTTGGCSVLGEGQTRCISASSMEQCRDGQTVVTTCAAGSECVGSACADALRYVRIVDVSGAIVGQHPGADIDAVALVSGGQTFYASRVTDSFVDPSISNRAPDITQILGPPHDGGRSCDLADGAEHWIALAGGEIVVAFEGDRVIRAGDQITVYECDGVADDRFDVTIGVSDRLEGDWTSLATDARGTITVTVP